jgi:hypothetical protein
MSLLRSAATIKHVIRLLSFADEPSVSRERRTARRYGAEVGEALIVLWEASDRVCAKRLKPKPSHGPLGRRNFTGYVRHRSQQFAWFGWARDG